MIRRGVRLGVSAIVLGTLAALAHASLGLAAPPATGARRPVVYEIPITGVVDPLVDRMVQRGLRDARRAHASAVIVRLDTPGGLDSSMRSIIKGIERSPVPVVCWVGPPGARAASAGTFILIGCPVAAMAAGTNVGAAHPVGITGQVMSTKVTNDAAAYIRSLAEARGRNADWAEKAVRDSVSVSADQAVQLHVADFLAGSRTALLRAVDGLTVQTADGPVAVATRAPSLRTVHLSWGESILHTIDDPNIAFVMFVAGVALLVLALIHHGVQVYGTIGLILVVSSLVVFSVLPVNIAGLILLVAAFVLFVLDIKFHAHGAPVVAGLIAFVFGGLYLYTGSVQVSRPLIIVLAVGFAALFAASVRAAVRTHHLPIRTHRPHVGEHAVVVRELAPGGVVRLRSEEWSAVVAGEDPAPAAVGATVQVVGSRGLTLEVVEVANPESGTTGEPQPATPTRR